MHRTYRIPATLRLTLVIVALVVVAFGGWLASSRSLGAAGTPEPTQPCVLAGTPVSGAIDTERYGCEPAGAGTPVTAGGLVVTLSLSSDQAAPQDIVVTVRDASGAPVDDATVVLVNTHLEMHHGDWTRVLVHDRDGRYLGAKVGMGMGGHWQTVIQITRPGESTVTFVFNELLHGIGE